MSGYREAIANTIADHSGDPQIGDECFKFGCFWGCRPDCPVFVRGGCELQEQNEEEFREKGWM